MSSWICCQLGAREHYAIPRALHQAGKLTSLITDAWMPPQSILNVAPNPFLRNLRDRYHPDLANAPISSFTIPLIQFETRHRLRRTKDWERTIARNHWYQKQVIQQLNTLQSVHSLSTPPILFTYSYAALDLLHYARRLGWTTVLGQIDPGIVEEKIVSEAHQNHANLAPGWQPAPPEYWSSWREECELADQIVVNSHWSSQALQQAGVPAHKLQVIPLAYRTPQASLSFQRTYPPQFSTDRPLRVLFLGQIILRKGIAALLNAAKQLQDYPIEFWLVGTSGIEPSHFNLPNIRWIGPVPRSQTSQYYQQCDIFLFPTLSDGFGLTQLEAQAWKLPLIVSRFCGEVVKDQISGFILSEVTGEAIAQTLISCICSPDQLRILADQAVHLDQFSLTRLQHNLLSLQNLSSSSHA